MKKADQWVRPRIMSQGGLMFTNMPASFFVTTFVVEKKEITPFKNKNNA